MGYVFTHRPWRRTTVRLYDNDFTTLPSTS